MKVIRVINMFVCIAYEFSFGAWAPASSLTLPDSISCSDFLPPPRCNKNMCSVKRVQNRHGEAQTLLGTWWVLLTNAEWEAISTWNLRRHVFETHGWVCGEFHLLVWRWGRHRVSEKELELVWNRGITGGTAATPLTPTGGSCLHEGTNELGSLGSCRQDLAGHIRPTGLMFDTCTQ